MLTLVKGFAACLMSALLLAGCRTATEERATACRTPPARGPADPESSIEGFERKVVHAKIVLEVEGTETFRIDERACLEIVEILGGRTPQQVAFLSVSTTTPLTIQDAQVIASVTLSPGLYHGADTYTLSGQGAVVVGGRQGLGSTSAVQVLRPQAGTIARFDRIGSSCRLKVETGASSGDLDCPQLTDESGKGVAFRWRWQSD